MLRRGGGTWLFAQFDWATANSPQRSHVRPRPARRGIHSVPGQGGSLGARTGCAPLTGAFSAALLQPHYARGLPYNDPASTRPAAPSPPPRCQPAPTARWLYRVWAATTHLVPAARHLDVGCGTAILGPALLGSPNADGSPKRQRITRPPLVRPLPARRGIYSVPGQGGARRFTPRFASAQPVRRLSGPCPVPTDPTGASSRISAGLDLDWTVGRWCKKIAAPCGAL